MMFMSRQVSAHGSPGRPDELIPAASIVTWPKVTGSPAS
jgi:hypothetical protein